MAGFLYPRTVAIYRPDRTVGVGLQDEYDAQTTDTTAPVFKGLPASIQVERTGRKNSTGLPADSSESTWRILIPKGSAARGSILDHDIVVDDLGARYQVSAPYWNSLGHALRVERLKV